MRKKLISILSCLMALLMLTSCGVTVSKQAKFDDSIESQEASETVVQNSNYKMELDTNNYGIILTNLKTGEKWGSSPIEEGGVQYDDLGMPIRRHPHVESILRVAFRNGESRTEDLMLSNTDAVQDGRVVAEKTDKGFKVDFYFDSMEVMVPVEYELLEDSVRISVDPTRIQEGIHRVTQISIAPAFAANKNDAADSYLFVPSGSGTIVMPNTVSAAGNTFTGEIYGRDMTVDNKYDISNSTQIRLPVYGAKNGNQATLAVIENGEETATLTANAGATQFGYSTVYPSFQIRGRTNHTATMYGSTEVDSVIYTNNVITDKLSVRYFPLSGADANYSGMARRYRKYLEDNNKLPKTDAEKALNINFYGGKMITKSFLGIPYKTLSTLTTVSEATDIVKELNSVVKGNLQVNLKGFTQTGVDIGAVGGKFTVHSDLGNKKQINEFNEFCEKNGLDTYIDFEVVKYKTSAGGFSDSGDSVFNAGELKATLYDHDLAVKTEEEGTLHYMLSPLRYLDAATKALDKTEGLGFSGISLASLTNFTYSDYTNKDITDFYSKTKVPDKAVEALKSIKKSKKKVLGTDANIYAAILSDSIVEAPVTSAKDYTFGYDVPFYSMVFKGRIPVYTQSANLASGTKDMLLHAVEGGMGVSYTVMSKWNNALINSNTNIFYNCVYSDIEKNIKSDAQKLADYFAKVSGAEIETHNVLASGIRETVYDNGVTVYVNYGDKAVNSPAGEVAPHNYIVLEKKP